jgi:hypothetical protein
MYSLVTTPVEANSLRLDGRKRLIVPPIPLGGFEDAGIKPDNGNAQFNCNKENEALYGSNGAIRTGSKPDKATPKRWRLDAAPASGRRRL